MGELIFSEQQLLTWINQYVWPMIRISAFLLAVPIIGARNVPARLRVILAVFITVLMAPLLPHNDYPPLMSLAAMVLVVKEVVTGLAMGFVMQVFLHLFVLAGQMIAMKMGLGFAAMNDPSTGVSVTVLSQLYLLLSTLLFLSVDGHLLLLQMLVESYHTVPVGTGLTAVDFHMIASMGSWMFAGGVVIALPLFTSVLVVNMAFGVMNRSAPQMNVFTVGFPITLIFGMLLMWLGLSALLPNFYLFAEQAFAYFRALAGLG